MGIQRMDVVSNRADFMQLTIKIHHDTADGRMMFIPDSIGKQRIAVFSGKDQLHEDLKERSRN